MADYLNNVAMYDVFTHELFARICRDEPDVKWVGVRPEYHGVSIEGDYCLILDHEDDTWWTLSVYTRDMSERAYISKHLSERLCVYETMEWLGVRKAEYGNELQYSYDGVWYDECVHQRP